MLQRFNTSDIYYNYIAITYLLVIVNAKYRTNLYKCNKFCLFHESLTLGRFYIYCVSRNLTLVSFDKRQKIYSD